MGLLVVLALFRGRGRLTVASLADPSVVRSLARGRDPYSLALLAAGFAWSVARRSGRALTARQTASLRLMLEQLGVGGGIEDLVEELAGFDPLGPGIQPGPVGEALARQVSADQRPVSGNKLPGVDKPVGADRSAGNLALWVYHVAGSGERGITREMLADILEMLKSAGADRDVFLARAREVWYPSVDALTVLGLGPGASFLTARARFRELAAAVHPDRSGEGQSDDFRLVREAHEELTWQAELRVQED